MSDYETDLVIWADRQASLLRRMGAGERVNDQVDWENVAEEIEALGSSDRRESRNRVRTILVHLIKLLASPATAPRAGWRETVREQRSIIAESPSLMPPVGPAITRELPGARGQAADALAARNETRRADPAAMT